MQKLRFINGNGVEINFTSGRYGVTEWSGFSNSDLNIQSQQVPFQDGAVFLDALYNPRELSITLAINDENDLEKRYELKRELISVMNAKLGEGYLYYKNDFLEKRIKVIPQLPIFENKNSNDAGTLKASLSWTAPEVYWEDVEETKVNLEKNIIINAENKGDFKAQLQVRALQTDDDFTELQNIATNEKIKILSSDKMLISTELGNKKIQSLNLSFNLNDLYIQKYAFNGAILLASVQNEVYLSNDFINFSKCYTTDYKILDVFYNSEDNKFYLVSYKYNYSQLKLYIYIHTTVDGATFETQEYIYSDVAYTLFDNAYFYKDSSVFKLFLQNYLGYFSVMNKTDTWSRPSSYWFENYYGCQVIIHRGEHLIYVTTTTDTTKIYEDSTLKLTLNFKLNLNSDFINLDETFDKFYLFDKTSKILYEISISDTYTTSQTWNSFEQASICYADNFNKVLLVSANKIYYLDSSNWVEIELPTDSNIKGIITFKDNVFYTTGNKIIKIDVNYECTAYNFLYEPVFINLDNTCLRNGDNYTFDGTLWIYKENNFLKVIKFIVDYDSYCLGVTTENYLYRITSEGYYKISELTSCDNFFINELNKREMCIIAGNQLGVSSDGITWSYYALPVPTGDYSIDSQNIAFNSKEKYYVITSSRIAHSDTTVYKSYDLRSWSTVGTLQHQVSAVIYDLNKNDFYLIFYYSFYSRLAYYYLSDLNNYHMTPGESDLKSFAVSPTGLIVLGQTNEISYKLKTGDFVRKQFPDLGYSQVVWVDFLQAFILTGFLTSIYQVYISYDAENWILLNNLNLGKLKVANNLYTIISLNYTGILKQDDNLISKLTSDSSMTLGLDIGNNYILSNFQGYLTYRQKYIGV